MIQNLTPSSPNCSSGGGGLTCTVPIIATAGSHTFTFETYDLTGATGNALSLNSTTQSLAANALTTVNVTLAGIPHSIRLSSTSMLVTGTQAGGFTLVGVGAHAFTVNAFDADGNMIIGPGAPAFAVSQGGLLGVVVTAPTGGSPNALSVTPPAIYTSGGATITVTASYSSGTNACAQTGAVCTTGPIAFGMREMLAVLSAGNSGSPPFGTVAFYSDTAGSMTLLGTSGTLSGGADALAFDKNGNMFVALSSYANVVDEYTPPYTGSPTVISAGSSSSFNYPTSLATDSSGDLYIGDSNYTVLEYAPGTTTPSRTLNPTVAGVTVLPNYLCTDPSGDLFVANNGSNSYGAIQEFAATGTTATHLVSNIMGINSIACDSVGNVFVAQFYPMVVSAVSEYTPGLVYGTTLTGTTNDPQNVAVDSANNVYVPNFGGSQGNLLTFAAGSNSIHSTLPLYGMEQTATVADSAGNIFSGERTGGIVYEYAAGSTTSTSNIPPVGTYYGMVGLGLLP